MLISADMNYQETLEFLFTSAPMFQNVGAGAYKEGLSTTKKLDEHFGHPHRSYHTIHVGGTNGKGSVSHTLAAILQSAGFRVGLYTSPHLADFRERIRVNGVPISEERVIRFVAEERSFFEPLHPSFFELTTALAFAYFEEEKADVAVVEVGLGGRLDCTNVISPLLSVITNISLDHTQFLGETLAQIAREKAGIIKENTPVVIGEMLPETRTVFLRKAQRKNAPLFFAEEERRVVATKVNREGGMRYDTSEYGEIAAALGGACQVKNTATILTAIAHLPLHITKRISAECVRKGFAEVMQLTGLTGRWQCLQQAPLVICDTGHNRDAWRYLSRQLKELPCSTLHIVFGVCADKDLLPILELLPQKATYYFTQPSVERALPAHLLREQAVREGLNGRAYPSVGEAYRKALEEADADSAIFVGGSSFVVADLLRDMTKEENKR